MIVLKVKTKIPMVAHTGGEDGRGLWQLAARCSAQGNLLRAQEPRGKPQVRAVFCFSLFLDAQASLDLKLSLSQ